MANDRLLVWLLCVEVLVIGLFLLWYLLSGQLVLAGIQTIAVGLNSYAIWLHVRRRWYGFERRYEQLHDDPSDTE